MPTKKAAHHGHKTDGNFVRAGRHIVSLAHVISAELPADDDENKTLQMKLTTGETFTLTGDETDAALEALGKKCDVEPE